MTIDPNTPGGNPNKGDGNRPQPARPLVPSFIPASVAAKAANPEPKNSKTSAIAIAFVAALVIASAGLGFAGGRLTAPAGTARGNFPNGANGGFQPGASGVPGGNRGGFGGGGLGGAIAVTGTVTAMANGTITVQTSAGQNITVSVPAGVTYHAQASAAAADVSIGSSVEITVKTGGRPEASGAPGGNPAPGGNGGFAMSATDILVMGK